VQRTAIVARVTVEEGKADEYIAAFARLIGQAEKEPGTLLYAVHRSVDDPHMFWTTEVYADGDAFAAHSASEVHAAAAQVFAELIAASGGTRVLSHQPLPSTSRTLRPLSCPECPDFMVTEYGKSAVARPAGTPGPGWPGNGSARRHLGPHETALDPA